jgi:molybdopterin-guanine dinucleotide biosynthesis protein A
MANKSSTNEPAPRLAGYILAGGKSRRMGRNKAGLPWGPDTLLDHMRRLVATVADEVHVVGTADFPDHLPGLGPVGGIATAIRSSSAPLNIVVAVDLPLLTAEFLGMFRDRSVASKHSLIVCQVASKFPLCLGLRQDAQPAIVQCLREQRSVRQLLELVPSEVITHEELALAGFEPAIFSNINTPEEWEAARQKFMERKGIT